MHEEAPGGDSITEALLGKLSQLVAQKLPLELDDGGVVDQDDFDGFVARNRPTLLAQLAPIAQLLSASTPSTAGGTSTGTLPGSGAAGPAIRIGEIPEHWTAAKRTKANLAAMAVLAKHKPGRQLTGSEVASLAQYSGWGGLKIKQNLAKMPKSLPPPEEFGLIHEYYTPVRVYEAAAEWLAGQLGKLLDVPAGDAPLRVLEPSAGIGRAPRAFQDFPAELSWQMVEYSALSSRMLKALFPNAGVYHGPFERWAGENHGRQFDVVVANPPYGERGEDAYDDPLYHRYQTSRAYLYFLRRTLDMLRPGGIGIYVVPTGFMRGKSAEFLRVRREVLRRHHLLAAFRLPSKAPQGERKNLAVYDHMPTDLLIFQARSGLLADVRASDEHLIEPDGYFKSRRAHILGKPVGRQTEGWDPSKPKERRGYQIEGTFTGLPDFTPRPMSGEDGPFVEEVEARVLVRGTSTRRIIRAQADDLDAATAHAEALGLRADDFLAAVAAQDADGAAGWRELHEDLLAWKAAHGLPAQHRGLQKLARKRVTGIERFLAIWTSSGELVAALKEQPEIQPRYRGAWTPLAVADWLYRSQLGSLTVAQLQQFFTDNGKPAPSWADIEHKLLRGSWCVGGPGWNELEPQAHYLTGFLWPKVDRAQARIDTHPDDVIAQRQLKDLTETIGWRSAPDILKECHPTDSWLPLELLSAFANEVLQFSEESAEKKRRRAEKVKKARGISWKMPDKFTSRALPPVEFERADGKLGLVGVPYGALKNTEKGSTPGVSRTVMNILGWANIDPGLISPHRREVIEDGEKSTESKSAAWGREQEELLKQWREWFEQNDGRMERLEQVYNRRLRGYVPRTYSTDPLPVSRWVSERHTPNPIRPYGYQNQAARRIVDNGCGLLAFDTGLGKTFTGINVLAHMRQIGRAKRPVVVAPNSIVWKWKRDFEKVLPDYRVGVIGSDLRYSRQKGGLKAYNDTPEQRAAKWTAFQAGEYDVVLLTYSALLRTKIDQGFRERYANQIISIRRDIAMAVDKALSSKKSSTATEDESGAAKRITERREAEIKARTKRWLEGVLSLPRGWKYDPGIDWHKLGVDFLMVDEAQNFKNLLASNRHGSKRDETKRAWALDFRCASVREHTGGTGVVLLSATPAKNDPVEFFNLLHLVNPQVWEQVGINNHEAWLNRYGHYVKRKVPSASGGKLEERLIMERFKNLDELRAVVYRWSEFKVAEDVGLKIPDAQRYVHNVELTDAQLEVLQGEFKELASIEEKLENAYKFNQGNKDPASKGAQIIQALKDKKRALALRIYLLNLHPELPGFAKQLKGKSKAAREAIYDDVPLEDAPKLQGCADVILESSAAVCDKEGNWCLNCGHIVFADSPVVHEWMRRILVERGIDNDRIVILNADTMSDLEERYQATVGFNGQGKPGDPEYQPPKYDIVIANAIAYEGMDLQRRTCAIHHLDVPHDPSTLQQRNGRGVRQGNKFAVVGLHYYFVRGSNELSRIERIERKRGWMASLVSSQARETNTTLEEGEDVSAGIEDLAIRYASDEDRAKLLELKAKREEQERQEHVINVQKATSRELRQLDTEFRRADREADPQRAAMLRDAAERGLQGLLAEVPKDVWDGDWHTLAARIRETSLFIPDRGLPLMPGDVLVRKMLHADGLPTSAPGTAFEVHRLGRDSEGRPGVWLREQSDLFPDDFILQDTPRSDEPQKGSERLIAERGWFFVAGEPLGNLSADEVAERHLSEAAMVARKLYTADDWHQIAWDSIDDRHRQVAWPVMEKRLSEGNRLSLTGFIVADLRDQIAFPMLRDGRLELHLPGDGPPAGATLIPPTDAGWEQLIALAKVQGGHKPLTWTALDKAAQWWWRDRRFPKGLWAKTTRKAGT